ncbi:PorP/SprF family type IX secretion system membrane protein [Flavobacterium sp. WC2509]|uniref:PorP/SprF family type IX secretion system membrane protein n=1 Tax=Flavobacterium sp. WC2509 TaxID=3461406 RepID=UPI004044B217
MRSIFINLAIMLLSFLCYSQQDVQYTQYMYNTINVNPAYAGSRGVMSIFGLYRSQWVGLDGAPVTNTLSLNSPIENSKLGFGVSIVNDRIGPTVNNTISGDLSYTIETSETYRLSFGIKATASLFNLNANKLNIKNQGDASLQDMDNYFSPNVGAGAYFYSDKMYLGLSSPSLLQTKMYNNNDIAVYEEKMNIYFMGGYVFDLSPSLKFKPTFLNKITQGAPWQLDVSGNFLINDKFVVGAAWRWSAAMSFLAGFQINEKMYIGYGYDLDTTNLGNYNSGSHEVFLRFELFKDQSRILSPRFF